MAPIKRSSYNAAFKLEVVEFAIVNGNRAAERKFNVSEKMVRDWRRTKDSLLLMKRTKKANRGHAARYPEIEKSVVEFVLSERAKCRAVSTLQIQMKAKEMASDLKIENFNANSSWCFRFMQRNRLSIRQRTTVAQQLPDNHQHLVDSFVTFTKAKIQEYNVQMSNIINMDEVPLTFDIPMGRTVEATNSKTITIKTTGHEKANFTVVLACSADGQKLPPMVIFKKILIPKQNFTSQVVVAVNKKGWMDEDMMATWINNVFIKRPGGFFAAKSL